MGYQRRGLKLMSGILSALAGSSGGGSVDFNVITGKYVNEDEFFTEAYYGYNATVSTVPPFGSTSPASVLFRGATVVGVWSYGAFAGYADSYLVALNGDTTGTIPYISGLKVNGTQLVLSGGPNYMGSYVGPHTQYYLPLATGFTPTLFGTTDGVTIPVTIA